MRGMESKKLKPKKTYDIMPTEINDRQKKKKQGKWIPNTSQKKSNGQTQENKMDKNKHAVTLSIYTETTVKTVKLSVQKKYIFLTVQDIK